MNAEIQSETDSLQNRSHNTGHHRVSSGGGGFNSDFGHFSHGNNATSGSASHDNRHDSSKKIIEMIRDFGDILPCQLNGNKQISRVLKMAHVFGRGWGDHTPRTAQNHDGSFVDDFLKIRVDGRKIFGGGGNWRTVKDTVSLCKSGEGTQRQVGHFNTARGVSEQHFEILKSMCLRNGSLFEDDQFQPVNSSVFYSDLSKRQIYWKRPHQITSNPQFFVGGASRFDVIQGELGDCWLLAAVTNLTMNETVFRGVVPGENSFSRGEYAGIFHFRFWQYGKWVEIVVDDYLPCNSNGELLFMHSESKNEYWSALLEKAYAKMYGSYEALKGGTSSEAMVDFTGGITEVYEIQHGPSNLYQLMQKAWARGSFLGCSIEPDPGMIETEKRQGLIRGHAYSITDVQTIHVDTPRMAGKIPLLRIRNPWGNDGEWRGAWSDGSPEWQFVPDEVKREISLTFDADGEFWMSNHDFVHHFQCVEICNLSPDPLEEDPKFLGKLKWEMHLYEGAWIPGKSAGGCRNYLKSFATNPQYIITLSEPDEDHNDGKCTVIVALMQKNRREIRQEGHECLTIGFAIYKCDRQTEATPLTTSFFKFSPSVARSPTFINLREVSCRFRLPTGTYCIVPSTFEPNEEGEFIIRIFSESPTQMHRQG